MIAAENEAKVHAEINRLSSKKDWPRLKEGQLELVRVAKKYARDIPHLQAAIAALCETLDHCPDSRELRQELCGDTSALNPRPRCPSCEDGGTVHQGGVYQRCGCRIGRMIHQTTLNELNDPPVPKVKVEPANTATVAKVLAKPVTRADVDREIEARRKVALTKAAGARAYGLKEGE